MDACWPRWLVPVRRRMSSVKRTKYRMLLVDFTCCDWCCGGNYSLKVVAQDLVHQALVLPGKLSHLLLSNIWTPRFRRYTKLRAESSTIGVGWLSVVNGLSRDKTAVLAELADYPIPPKRRWDLGISPLPPITGNRKPSNFSGEMTNLSFSFRVCRLQEGAEIPQHSPRKGNHAVLFKARLLLSSQAARRQGRPLSAPPLSPPPPRRSHRKEWRCCWRAGSSSSCCRRGFARARAGCRLREVGRSVGRSVAAAAAR